MPLLARLHNTFLLPSNPSLLHLRLKMSNQIRTINPATHEVIFDQPGTSLEEAGKIATASKQAFQSWRAVSLEDRTAIVKRTLQIIDSRIDELAKELTTQMGRPIRYCAGEIKTAALRAEHMIKIAKESLADLPGEPQDGFRRMVKQVPLGPILIASAWNVRSPLSTNTGDMKT